MERVTCLPILPKPLMPILVVIQFLQIRCYPGCYRGAIRGAIRVLSALRIYGTINGRENRIDILMHDLSG